MDTLERVIKCLAESLNVPLERITPEATLGNLLRQDQWMEPITQANSRDSDIGSLHSASMAVLELGLCLSDEFEVEIPDSDLKSLPLFVFDRSITVRQLAGFVDRYRRK